MRRALDVLGSLAVVTGLAALGSGCAGDPDPQQVEGIGTTEDQIFRTLVLDDVPAPRAFAVARAVVRLRFAGGPVLEDPLTRTIELERTSPRKPVRFRLYVRVVEAGDGSVVEIFCPVDELREEPDPETLEAWRFLGQRHASLENEILHAIWNELEVKPLGGTAGD